MPDDVADLTPIVRVTLNSRRTKAGEWAIYFTYQGKKHEFVRPELADAVMAAGAFLESHAPIGLMRISETPH